MITYAFAVLTALKLDLYVSSVNMRDILVLVIALVSVAALVVVGSPYTLDTFSYSPSLSPSVDSPSPATEDVRPPTSLVEDELDVEPQCPVARDMAPFPANLDESSCPAVEEYKTGLGLTSKDLEAVRMVALHTDDSFDFAPPRAGHVKGVMSEKLLKDEDVYSSSSSSSGSSSSSLGYWASMCDAEREFTWRTEYGDDSWLFDRPLYREVLEKKSVWRRIRSGLKKKVLRRRF